MTDREIREAISNLDENVDPACQQLLTEYRQREQWKHSPAATNASEEKEPGAATASAPSAEQDSTVQQVSADDSGDAPGQCKHKLVCLPSTPTPTMMLMCPSKDEAQAQAQEKTEAGIAVLDPEVSEADTNDTAPDVAPVKPSGGVADWNWEQDPARQL